MNDLEVIKINNVLVCNKRREHKGKLKKTRCLVDGKKQFTV